MGPALCLASAVFFGAMAVFGKLAYDAGVTPTALLLIRFSLAAVLLVLILTVRPGLRRTRAAGRRARVFGIAFGLGAIGYALQASLYFAALERMDASLLSLILYTYPVLVTLAAVTLGRDRLTPARSVALIAASCGTLLVLLGAGAMTFHPYAAVLAFGSAITYTVYVLVSDTVVHQVPPVLLSAFVMAGAAVALGVRALVTGGVDLSFEPAGWWWLGCIVVVSTVMAMLAFFAGLRRTGPSTASILSTFEPVVTTVLAAVTLGEMLSPLQIAGGGLVLSSVAVLQIRVTPRQPADLAPTASGHQRADRPDPAHPAGQSHPRRHPRAPGRRTRHLLDLPGLPAQDQQTVRQGDDLPALSVRRAP